MSQPAARWRPADEAEAASTLATFVEWLRAVRGCGSASPESVQRWALQDRPRFLAAVAAFAGVRPEQGLLAHLADDARTALVVADGPAASRSWSRAAVRGGIALPAPVQAALVRITPPDLPALAASHLLGQEIRPDDRLIWRGAWDEPWPYGAWLAGACVVLGPAPALAGDRVFAARPEYWRDSL